ncbi:putative hydrolase of the HAD superfamily [Herbihabitans rhizosphaerae]|uniref:Putative hydrolase of the HAD superfamily n=2 Tax=Herbihabitans rhizosphaerae TaxID=1872711 RepID=A0A4Q7L222_9PSEU|nr:putative hydrolase of the HAD superfamily [Herbihabitans rhizosphaerae]
MHAQMAEMLSIDANRLAQEWESTTYDSNVGGIVDTSARFAVILERLGVTGDVDVGKLAQMEHDMLLENIELGPWAAEFLIQLRRRGYKVGLVSNCSPSVNWALNASGLRSHFDCEVLSYQIRAVKPDPRIYDHALSLLNCQAQEAYFLGDGNNGELSAAESCGITPIEVTWASGGRELPSVSNWKRVSDFRMAAELIDEEARWTFSR